MRFAKEEEEEEDKIRNVRSRAHENAAGYGWSPGVLTHHATNFDSCPLLLMGHDISIIEKSRHRMLPDLGVQSIRFRWSGCRWRRNLWAPRSSRRSERSSGYSGRQRSSRRSERAESVSVNGWKGCVASPKKSKGRRGPAPK